MNKLSFIALLFIASAAYGQTSAIESPQSNKKEMDFVDKNQIHLPAPQHREIMVTVPPIQENTPLNNGELPKPIEEVPVLIHNGKPDENEN